MIMMNVYIIYFLLLKNGKIYTGITNDLERRISEHFEEKDPKSYTSRFKVEKLIGYLEFSSPNEAIDAEKKIKKWSHAKKIALLNQDWDTLKMLSKKYFSKDESDE